MKKTILLLAVSGSAVLNALAAIIPPAVKDGATPVIDGTLGDPAWQKACVMELAQTVMPLRPALPGTKTTLRFLVGGGRLFIGAECQFPPGAVLKGEAREHDAPVFEDESLEVFLAPDGGPTPELYYHFALNIRGSTTERKVLDPAWNVDWPSAVAVGQDRWTAEMAIPLAALSVSNAPGHYWQINGCRNMYDARGSFAQGLTLARPGYHSPSVLMMTGPVGAPVLLAAVQETLARMESLRPYLTGPDQRQFVQLTQYRQTLESAKGASIAAPDALAILETAWKSAGRVETRIILNYMFSGTP